MLTVDALTRVEVGAVDQVDAGAHDVGERGAGLVEAAPMISKQRRAWTAGSGSTASSGHWETVPATNTRSPTARRL